jgi:hypothetical protein
MINRIRSINWDLETARAIEQTEPEMILFDQNQLVHGLDGDNNKLPPYKSPKYAKVKHEKNPLAGLGIPDYRLTGDMFNQMYIDFEGNQVKIKSHASYWGDLTARGGSPFSLSPESKKEYSEDYVMPRLVRNIAGILKVPVV